MSSTRAPRRAAAAATLTAIVVFAAPRRADTVNATPAGVDTAGLYGVGARVRCSRPVDVGSRDSQLRPEARALRRRTLAAAILARAVEPQPQRAERRSPPFAPLLVGAP